MSAAEVARPVELDGPALFDTGVWAWARDRRLPHLADWFNAEVEAERVLVCDLVVLELTRLAPNEDRARGVADRLDAFESPSCRIAGVACCPPGGNKSGNVPHRFQPIQPISI